MKVYGSAFGDLNGIPERVRASEAAGYDGLVSAEIANDPFFPLLLAAEHTQRVDLMTAIAVAFARNPMLLAQIGHDLNAYSKGRFILGLGSQIKPHITRRFSMQWSKPAARMRELVLAMRAIWSCWYESQPLDFRGEFYSHTLMTPMFTPGNAEYGPPRVMVAAVGPLMAEAAAEVADGLIAHAFTTPKYLREVTLPAVERGLAKAGRSRDSFEINCPAFVVSGETDEAFAGSRQAVRQQVAFYGSTPAYRPVLELHGWDELGPKLTQLSKRGEWAEMGECLPDEVLETIAVVAKPGEVGRELKSRFDGLVDSWTATFDPEGEDLKRELMQTLQG